MSVTALTVTEADRATARRVIRRHVGAKPQDDFRVGDRGFGYGKVFGSRLYAAGLGVRFRKHWVGVSWNIFDAACLAAAQGRAYAAALRGAR